ncbi:glycosyltransferase family 2 protein [Chishuiella sp.]|uniref:glycosyltransferase family 2 protein n=1 Tax=Chishuiella sp. TaxID=1969467 RepID=UPI0028AE6F31|nr:glycosyltransferase family 2 protein [Chishuiella sp.]
MENQFLISIIVPCYNQAQYLDECLQSVLDQIYTNWECIIINDDSPDNTDEIASEWVKKDSRFRYIYQNNLGVAAARNNGINNALGEWILPLDGDDKISENYLNKAFEKIKEGYTLIYSNAIYFGKINKEWILEDYSLNKMLYHNIIFCSAIFKKNHIRYDTKMDQGLEDWEFWINYIFSHKEIKICKLSSFEFFYRIKENSRNNTINTDNYKFLSMKNYVYYKHWRIYEKYFGDYFTLYEKNLILSNQNKDFKLKLESKRIKILNKFLSFFNK